MKQISEIIQGNEDTLFARVLEHLRIAEVSRRKIAEFEIHKSDAIDKLIDISYRFLLEAGYYE